MTVRNLFVTPLYEAQIADEALLAELAHSIRSLAEDDESGQRWSKEHRYVGYTSYASLNDLPKRDPIIGDLAKILMKHAAAFSDDCAFDLHRKPKLDSLWVNLLRGSGHHSAHIHPHSIISGTLYVELPKSPGAIRFEDPRLPMMMAAPTRQASSPEELQPFVTVKPYPGLLLLWESWLRHEVLPAAAKGDRLSISFNFV